MRALAALAAGAAVAAACRYLLREREEDKAEAHPYRRSAGEFKHYKMSYEIPSRGVMITASFLARNEQDAPRVAQLTGQLYDKLLSERG